jgi:hypothetical protein
MSGGDVEGWVERLRRLGRDVIFRAICVLTLVTASVGFAFQHPDQGDKLNAPAEVVRPDERIADYTFWLMAFTGILGVVSIVQFYFLVRSDQTTRKIANASILQAKAAVGAELPILVAERAFVEEARPPEDDTRHLPAPDNVGFVISPAKFAINFRNVGRTTAIIESYCINYKICEDLPEIPSYESFYDITLYAKVNEAVTLTGVPLYIPSEDRQRLSPNGVYLWLFGYIRYRDFLGNVTKQGFCFLYGQGIRPGNPYGFGRCELPNYTKKTSEPVANQNYS